MMGRVDCLSIVYQLRPEGDQEDEQGTPEGIQESWQSLVHQLQPSDLSKVYEHLSEEYLIRFGTVDDRKVVVHSEFGPTDLARLFRMAFQLASTNLSVPNHPSTRPQLPLLKFEGLDTRSKRSYMTCKSRWTIGMQRLEGLSNPRLNKNRDGRDLKCRMRQSRSCEKRDLCTQALLRIHVLNSFLSSILTCFGHVLGSALPSCLIS